jgi:hypothetical protein
LRHPLTARSGESSTVLVRVLDLRRECPDFAALRREYAILHIPRERVSMTTWRFLDYITEERVVPISEWYDAQDGEVRAAFDLRVSLLRIEEDWEHKRRGRVKELTKAHQGLTQIPFEVDVWDRVRRKFRRRRLRALGVWRKAAREFVFLGGVEEHGQNYVPADAFDRAMRHWRALARGRGETRDHT